MADSILPRARAESEEEERRPTSNGDGVVPAPIRNRANFTMTRPVFSKISLALATALLSAAVSANPGGPQVAHGQAQFFSGPRELTVTNTPGAIINWRGFAIARDEITRFIQQGAHSAVLNRVLGSDPSAIFGQLLSNGRVFLINPNGIVFGAGAIVDTAGFLASTLTLSDAAFIAGRYDFKGDRGSIVNQGFIRVRGNGSVALIAPDIENSGIIQAEGGQILLAAGREITLAALDLDDIRFRVQAPSDRVLNLGKLIAENGAVGVFAGTLGHHGLISATRATRGADGTVRLEATSAAEVTGAIVARGASGPGGRVEVLGADVTLRGARIDASGAAGGGTVLIGGDYQGRGPVRQALTTAVDRTSVIAADATGSGNGGTIIAWSTQTTTVDGTLTARGGPAGGDGGLIETSGKQKLVFTTSADVSAPRGRPGTWLLDPEDITIDSGQAASIEGTLNKGGNVYIKTSDSGSGEGNIAVNASITKTAGDDASLGLDAHNRIDVNAPITSQNSKLNVRLRAGRIIKVSADVQTNGGNYSSVIVGAPEPKPQTDPEVKKQDQPEPEPGPADSRHANAPASQNPAPLTVTDAAVVESANQTSGNTESEASTVAASAPAVATTDTGTLALQEDTSVPLVDLADDALIGAIDHHTTSPTEAAGPVPALYTVTNEIDTTLEATGTNVANAPVPEPVLAFNPVDTRPTVAAGNQPDSVARGSDTQLEPDADALGSASTTGAMSSGQDPMTEVSTPIQQPADTTTSAKDAFKDSLNIVIDAEIKTQGGDISIDAGRSGSVGVNAGLDASDIAPGQTGGNIKVTAGKHIVIRNNLTAAENVTFNAENVEWLQGTVRGPGKFTTNGTFTIDDDAGPKRLEGFSWENLGTVNWVDGDVVLADASINNRGSFNALSDNQMNGDFDYAEVTIIDRGNFNDIFENRGDGIEDELGLPGAFHNSGIFTNSGDTTFGGLLAFNNTGQVNADGGNVAFDGGFYQTAGNSNLGGGGISSLASIDIEGGSLTGTGAIDGDVNVGTAAGPSTVVPGNSPGIITILGGLNLGPNAVLNMELFSNSVFDQIVASGVIKLGGQLNVAAVGFSPVAGDEFPLLVSTSNDLTGAFAVANLPVLNALLTGNVLDGTFRVLAGQNLPLDVPVTVATVDLGIVPDQTPTPGVSVTADIPEAGIPSRNLVSILVSLFGQIPDFEQQDDLVTKLRQKILECR